MIPLKRVRYRVAQFVRTLAAPLRPLDAAYAGAHLAPSLLELFRALPPAEQVHALALCRTLEARGQTDPDLLAAALLHDVGKLRVRPRLWERVIAVLGEHYLPARAEMWAMGAPRGLRRAFVIRQQHAAWGAELAADAGASPRTVELIRRHHSAPGADAELALLQTLDDG